jgi:CxxC motif-containing protein (DUF1111 family)
MRAPRRGSFGLAALAASGLVWVLATGVSRAGELSKGPKPGSPATRSTSISSPASSPGEALFLRKWDVDDPRGRGGDGLGPVFNERSCVACHGLGGTGGGGKVDKNVDLLSANPIQSRSLAQSCTPQEPVAKPALAPAPAPLPAPVDRSKLAKIHPGLVSAQSVVLHRFGINPTYVSWRNQLLSPNNNGRNNLHTGALVLQRISDPRFNIVLSHRNATALFGSGQIDAIEDVVIEREAERQKGLDVPTKGRVARQKDGRIGRFGWKAQVPHLRDFVLNACAVELGLETPTHHQTVDPFGNGARPGAIDMSDEDCDALIDYVRNLPAPIVQDRDDDELGFERFTAIGCADCHKPNLGRVEGIFSDLLLHDMGGGLSDSGASYGSMSPGETPSPDAPGPGEWRTPPLWGVADSAPYLHDGRAATLSDAIRAHGGQAQASAREFEKLSKARRQQVLGFLLSLTAPRSGGVKLAQAR